MTGVSIDLHYPNRQQWTLAAVLKLQVERHGDRDFLIEGDGSRRRYGFRTCLEVSRDIGSGFRRLGLTPGDRVMMMMDNCPELILTWFSTSFAGLIEVPVDPQWTEQFAAHAIRLVRPRAIVVSAGCVNAIENLATAAPEECLVFVTGDEGLEAAVVDLNEHGWDARPFGDLLSGNDPLDDHPVDPRDTAAIIFTSGTTGPAKGVMVPNAEIHLFGEQNAGVMELSSEDCYQCALPLFHANAQFMVVYGSLLTGASVVMYQRFSASDFSERLREEPVTCLNLIGGMMDWAWQQPPQELDARNQLRRILSGPIPPVEEQFKVRFGVDAIVTAYGMTEISLPLLSPAHLHRPLNAVGKELSEFFEVAVVDPCTDEAVPIGEVGELVVRPREPWIVNSGYWDMPEPTAAARRNLWLHTGDAFRVDEAGWFYFMDRLGDSLRRHGTNISSFDLEAAIASDPGVVECAVVAVTGSLEQESEVLAVLVLSQGSELEVVAERANPTLPRAWQPRYWRTVEQLPKTPSGRVQKAILRAGGTDGALDLGRIRR